MSKALLEKMPFFQFKGFNDVIARYKKRVTQKRTFNQTVKELSAMTDRELMDIGLHRSEIKRVAMEFSYDNWLD